MRFFPEKKEKDYRYLRRFQRITTLLLTFITLTTFSLSYLATSDFYEKIDSSLTLKSELFYEKTNTSFSKVSSISFSKRLQQIFDSQLRNRDLAIKLGKNQKNLRPINKFIREENLFDHGLKYAEKQQVLASNDNLGQIIIWRDSLGVFPNKNGNGFKVSYDESFLDHLEQFTLLGPLIAKNKPNSDLVSTKALNGPLDKPYSYMYPSIIGRYKRVIYPGYSDTNRWKFFIPPIHDHWKQFLQNMNFSKNDTTVVTPIYLDALTGRPTLTLLNPIILDKKIQASVLSDWFYKELNESFLDEYTQQNVIWFTSSKHILNSTAEIRKLLSLEEKRKYIIPKILNRYVHNYRTDDSVVEAISKLKCEKDNKSVFELAGGIAYNFVCNQLDLGDFHFVSEGGIQKDKFYLGFFVKQLNPIFPNLANHNSHLIALSIFFVLLGFVLVQLSNVLKKSIYFSIYQAIYPKRSPPNFLKSPLIEVFGNELNDLKTGIEDCLRRSLINIQIIERSKQRIAELSNLTRDKLRILCENEFVLFKEANEKNDIELFRLVYLLHTYLKEDIDDLLVSELLNKKDLKKNHLQVKYLIENFLRSFCDSQQQTKIIVDNRLDTKLLIQSEKEIFSSILARIFGRVLLFFHFENIILSSENRDTNLIVGFELYNLALRPNLRAKFNYRDSVIHTIKSISEFFSKKIELLTSLGIDSIDCDFSAEKESLKIKLILNQSKVKDEISSKQSQIYRAKTKGVHKNYDVLVVSEEPPIFEEYLIEGSFSLKSLEFLIYERLSKGRNVAVFIESCSSSYIFKNTSNHLKSSFQGDPVDVLGLEFNNFSDLQFNKQIGLSQNQERSFLQSEHFLVNTQNEIFKNEAQYAYLTVTEISSLSLESEDFNQNNLNVMETAQKHIDFEFYQGEDDYFHKNYIKVDSIDEFEIPSAHFDVRKEEHIAILRVRHNTLNFVVSKKTSFSSFERELLEYLGTQVIVSEHKFLNFQQNLQYLKVFQSLLKNSKNIILIKKMSGNKTLVLSVNELGDLQEETVSGTFYLFRRYLSAVFDNYKDDVLFNPEQIKKHQKKILDPHLKSLIIAYLK